METKSEVIARFKKNQTEEVRISFTEFKGYKLIDLRVWYEDREGQRKPTKQGIAISRELIPELKKAILEAEEIEARNKGG